MPYTTITAGSTILSSWANANVRDQVVTPWSSSGTRSSGITSAGGAPVNGMVSTLTANDETNGIYVYNGVNWRAPWNMPWGILSVGTVSTDQAISSTTVADITGLSTGTITFLANRYYRATLSMYVSGNASATNRFTSLTLTNGAGTTTFGTFPQQSIVVQDNMSYCATSTFTTSGVAGTVKVRYILSNSNAVTVKGGAGTASVSELVIEDLGPAGAPV